MLSQATENAVAGHMWPHPWLRTSNCFPGNT